MGLGLARCIASHWEESAVESFCNSPGVTLVFPMDNVIKPPRFLRVVHNVKTCVLPHVSEPFNCIRWTVRWLVILDPLATLSDRKFAVYVMRKDGRNQSSLRDASEWDAI